MKRAVGPIVLLAHVLGGCASGGSPPPHGPDPAGEASSPATAAQEPDRHASPEEAAESEAVARQVLGERRGDAWKVGSDYQWLTVGKLYWVKGPQDDAFLVAVVSGERPPVRLTGDIVALKSFLAKQFNGRLPGAGALTGIARLLKDAIIGKGGSIATPVRESVSNNEWSLEFNVIKGSGAVDVLRASGTASPLTLQHVSVGVMKPPLN